MGLSGNIFVTRRIPQAGLEVLRQSGVQVTVSQDDEEQGVERGDLLAGVEACDVLVDGACTDGASSGKRDTSSPVAS